LSGESEEEMEEKATGWLGDTVNRIRWGDSFFELECEPMPGLLQFDIGGGWKICLEFEGGLCSASLWFAESDCMIYLPGEMRDKCAVAKHTDPQEAVDALWAFVESIPV
jgi:hypothetical protein